MSEPLGQSIGDPDLMAPPYTTDLKVILPGDRWYSQLEHLLRNYHTSVKLVYRPELAGGAIYLRLTTSGRRDFSST